MNKHPFLPDDANGNLCICRGTRAEHSNKKIAQATYPKLYAELRKTMSQEDAADAVMSADDPRSKNRWMVPLEKLQQESARTNEMGGVIAFLVGVVHRMAKSKDPTENRALALRAIVLIDAWHTNRWTPGPTDDPADWKDTSLPSDNLLDIAWGIIANVSGGDWSLQSAEWQEAAKRWRDGYVK